MKLAFRIAWRFLNTSRGQSILISLGIATGIAVQIFIGLLIQSLQLGLINSTVGNSSQVTVLSTEESGVLNDWQKIGDMLRQYDQVINVSPSATRPAFIVSGDYSGPATVRGFIFAEADGIYGFEDSLYEGRLPTGEKEVLMGRDLAENLGLSVNSEISLLPPAGAPVAVTITGIFDLKVAAINNNWIITDILTAQAIFELSDGVTAIEMQVADVFAADEVAANILNDLADGNYHNNDIKVDNWKDQNEQLLSGLQGQSISSLVIQIFVMIAVIMGIASVLAVSVLQKSRQIGILKAMGVKDKVTSQIFLFQGLILGICGGLFGILLGLGLIYSFTAFAVNPDGTPVVEIIMNYRFVAFSGLVAVLASMLAALIPAIKSSRLDPMEVIRNG